MQTAYLQGAWAAIEHFDENPGSTLDDAKSMVKCARGLSCPDDLEIENLLLFLVHCELLLGERITFSLLRISDWHVD